MNCRKISEFYRPQIPPKIPLVQQAEILQEIGLKKPLCYDKRICVTGLTKEERLKHNQFIQKSMTRDEVSRDGEGVVQTI
jgi:hypothetical protein